MSTRKKSAIAKIIKGHEAATVDALLESSFWHPSINAEGVYRRRSDDTDGDDLGIVIAFSHDGDACVQITSFCNDRETGEKLSDRGTHRFRTGFGGGSSLRVRMAFMILARAIQMDEADRPDR